MSNFRKSFSFRNGIQVDDDNFIVNANGLVGIGTTIPTSELDVRGTLKVVGIFTASYAHVSNQVVSGVLTATTYISGITSIRSGIITATSTSGIVTYYGDGSKLLNLPTSQWLDVDTGIGFTSIYAQGNVGIATNYPYYTFQIGSNPSIGFGIGFNSTGNVYASGIITASSFSGSLNANDLSSGTVSNSRLPSNINVSGIITASSFSGNLVGIASTANSITSTANITVNSINSGFSTTGISTIHTKLHSVGSIGIGTANPTADIHIRKSGISTIQLTSNGSYESSIIFGRSLSLNGNNASIRFGNTNGSYSDSTESSLDIINYDLGNVNHYLQLGAAGIGTGNFNWIYGQTLTNLMTLTYDGKLGINQSSPTNTLHVVGTSTVTGNSFVGSDLSVSGNINNFGTITSPTVISGISSTPYLRIRTTSSTYPFQIGSNPDLSGGGVGMNESGKIITKGNITADSVYTGIITSQGFTSGTGTPVAISVSGNQLTFSVVGVGSTSLTLY